MFEFFKNKQKETNEPLPSAPASENKYPVAVQEIHREFHSAAENLLKEAKTIIDEAATKDVQKVSRLEKLGFKQAGQVTELKPLIQKAELSKEQIELVKYYQREYPLNRFITEEQVKNICYKYNLICGEVSRFKGFVPEKNLREIEKFKLKPKEEKSLIFIDKNTGEYIFLNEDDFTEHGTRYCIEDKNEFYIVDYLGRDIYGPSLPLMTNKGLSRFLGKNTSRGIIGAIQDTPNILQICAPVKDMDLTGMTIDDGYKMQKIHVPDPVVLQPVKGGYLILTAWGDEASDPEVVNNINN